MKYRRAVSEWSGLLSKKKHVYVEDGDRYSSICGTSYGQVLSKSYLLNKKCEKCQITLSNRKGDYYRKVAV